MRLFNWIRGIFGWRKKYRSSLENPLREFIYLDEVSLTSLLSSQTGEIPESKSESVQKDITEENSNTIGLDVTPLSFQDGYKYQTTNSSAVQTSRKANVQSWFREFHKIEGLRLIETRNDVERSDTVEEILEVQDRSIIINSEDLYRGALVEFRVELVADPVFHLGTLVSEYSAMAEAYPKMFSDAGTLDALEEAKPINKLLQRFLAGLIPIRAKAVDYVIIEVDGKEYLTHKNAILNLDIPSKPLEVVGVTEHLAYWKDIRRVLFSGAEFILLGRISRKSLHTDWTPVKLADIFTPLVPDLVTQINTATFLPIAGQQVLPIDDSLEDRLILALNAYLEAIIQESQIEILLEDKSMIQAKILNLRECARSAEGQRKAFSEVSRALNDYATAVLTPEQDLLLREKAQEISSLGYFPEVPKAPPSIPLESSENTIEDDVRVLDVEVVAIYW